MEVVKTVKTPKEHRNLFIDIKTESRNYEFKYNIVSYTVDELFMTVVTTISCVSIPIRLIIEIKRYWKYDFFTSSAPFPDEQYELWDANNE